MRLDPFRDLDRLTREPVGRRDRSPDERHADRRYRQGESFSVHLDMPGVDPSSIELTVEKNVLTVSAERGRQWGTDVELLVTERPSGSFTRQLFLGETLDADHVQASCDNGVLTITIPVAEKAKPRKVEIGHGDGRATAIEANASA
ncbi:MAG: hypothetical protein QOE93_1994 [Actinomycetota bacterium]|nr:hypothetical protein [Actinomycetota bacterium]